MSDENRLQHYLSAWGLSAPQFITQTHTSQIYSVRYQDETCILKLLAPNETEEQVGALALAHFAGRGAVRLWRHDEGAQLMEYAQGDELVTIVERGEDAAATRIIAEVIQELHAAPLDLDHLPQGLFGLERWFRALFTKARADKSAGIASIYLRGAALAERLLADPREIRVLHGDIHHQNIRGSARGWLAFDPKGLIGERTYDCANTLCNPVITELTELVHNESRLLNNAGILAEALKIELPRLLAYTYAYACLSGSWSHSIGVWEEEEWALKVAAIVEPHLKLP